jgi:hypothetical protein
LKLVHERFAVLHEGLAVSRYEEADGWGVGDGHTGPLRGCAALLSHHGPVVRYC